MAFPSWVQAVRRPWVWWLAAACLLVASRWLIPHATVCEPEARPSFDVPGPEGRKVSVRPGRPLVWFEFEGQEARWLRFQGDFSPESEGRLGPEGIIHSPPETLQLRRDRWGRPSVLEVEDALCLVDEHPCQILRRARVEYALSCGWRPRWALPGTTARNYLARLLMASEPAGMVLGGLLAGLLLSICEARWARHRAWGQLAAGAAISARVLLPVVGVDVLSALLGKNWNPVAWLDDGEGVGRHPVALLQMGCLGLGQLLAAAVVAFRREDHPTGRVRAAPPVPVLLGLTALLGLVLWLRVDPGAAVWWKQMFPLRMLPVWGLLYLSVPVLVWSVMPWRIRRHLKLASLATVLFLVGQLMVGSNTQIQLFQIFLGLDAWRMLEPGQHVAELENRLFVWTTVAFALGAAALTVSLTNRGPDAPPP